MYGSYKNLKKRMDQIQILMDLIYLLILNGHINGSENLSVLNIYFIEALITVLFSSKLKVWLPYNKRFTNTSSVRFEISLAIFLQNRRGFDKIV